MTVSVDCPRTSVRPPNVVLIITDDQGWGGLGINGNPMLDTPVLDALGRAGAMFNRYYVSPVCAPTRASLMTGRYHPRTGMIGIRPGLDTMRCEEQTLAAVLQQAGYATGIFGKWHNGTHYPYTPLGRGFDEHLGFSAGHWSNYFDTTLEHNGKPLPTRGFITDVLTDGAINFIQRHRAEPFFCYIPYNAPHVPHQVPDRYFEKYKQRGASDWVACSYGMIENVNDNVHRVLETLERLQLTNDTIVIFTTDHGPDTECFNGGMRGWKRDVDEGGVRVPLLIHAPGVIRSGTVVSELTADIDLFPTILDLCGVSIPNGLSLDGQNLAPLLRGQSVTWPDRMIFSYCSREGIDAMTPGAVRTQRHRLVNRGDGYELYDMIRDSGQAIDISVQNPDTTAELIAAYESWFQDVTSNVGKRFPIPIGHVEAPLVELPVTQANRTSGLAFIASAPGWNHDWLTCWNSTDESVSWEVDVAGAGEYEVAVRHTCPWEDAGALIRVNLGSRPIEARIDEGFDPDPMLSPDRVLRSVAYEKSWANLALGRVALDAGRMRVSVQAVELRGRQAMEMKSLQLQRV